MQAVVVVVKAHMAMVVVELVEAVRLYTVAVLVAQWAILVRRVVDTVAVVTVVDRAAAAAA